MSQRHTNSMDTGVQPDQARYRADVFEDGSVAIIRDTPSTKMKVVDEGGGAVVKSMELTQAHHDELVGLNTKPGKDVRFDHKTGQFFERDLEPRPDDSNHSKP
jgi:hypothetical protein